MMKKLNLFQLMLIVLAAMTFAACEKDKPTIMAYGMEQTGSSTSQATVEFGSANRIVWQLADDSNFSSITRQSGSNGKNTAERIYGGKKVSAAIAAMFIMNTMNEKNSARFSFCEILPRSVERRSSDEIRESRMRHSTHSAIGNRVKLLTKLVVIQRSPIGSSRLRTDGV